MGHARLAPQLADGLHLATGSRQRFAGKFRKHLSEEVAADGIGLNVVHPRMLRTPRHPERITARTRFAW